MALLARHFGPDRFAAIVTGDDVVDRKPDPSAYRVALDRLGVGPEGTVAVEDSDHGVTAARGAGLAVAAVTNDYTATHALAGAAVILDSFGTPDAPARVRHDPTGAVAHTQLDLATLTALARSAAQGVAER